MASTTAHVSWRRTLATSRRLLSRYRGASAPRVAALRAALLSNAATPLIPMALLHVVYICGAGLQYGWLTLLPAGGAHFACGLPPTSYLPGPLRASRHACRILLRIPVRTPRLHARACACLPDHTVRIAQNSSGGIFLHALLQPRDWFEEGAGSSAAHVAFLYNMFVPYGIVGYAM